MSTTNRAVMAAHLSALTQRFPDDSAPGRKLSAWLQCNDVAAVATLCDERDQLADNVAAFAAALGLDDLAREVFRFVLLTDCDAGFAHVCSEIVSTRAIDATGLIAAALGSDVTAVMAVLQGGPLKQLQLVDASNGGNERFSFFVPYQIVQALLPPQKGLADIERKLVGAPMPAQLSLADFDHVAPARDFLLRLLRGAAAKREKGINILIHGGPGTGKTEFCKTIAAAMAHHLYAVGETDDDGHEPTRYGRIGALHLADRLMQRRQGALLLFDEMEDILPPGRAAGGDAGGHRRAGSKVFFNRLLESNTVPVFWTANAIDEFDPAFLRRMIFIHEMKPLPVAMRARFWQGAAARHDLALDDGQAAALARRYRVAPAIMTQAAHAVTLAAGAPEEISYAVAALTGMPAQPAPSGVAAAFDVALVNADLDLGLLTERLARNAAPSAVSLCLHGPSGTGKSAYARALAERMGFEPLVKRGSDLLSKWVGGTERLLANAFAEAREERRFLIFDEVESLLWERGMANQSWEVSATNELLTQMETHEWPIACTTNHLGSVDRAALRRFGFKIGFDFMAPAQMARAYQHFFARPAPPALHQLQNLTAADFALAARKRQILQIDPADDAAILDLLAAEVSAKQLPQRRIGFGR